MNCWCFWRWVHCRKVMPIFSVKMKLPNKSERSSDKNLGIWQRFSLSHPSASSVIIWLARELWMEWDPKVYFRVFRVRQLGPQNLSKNYWVYIVDTAQLKWKVSHEFFQQLRHSRRQLKSRNKNVRFFTTSQKWLEQKPGVFGRNGGENSCHPRKVTYFRTLPWLMILAGFPHSNSCKWSSWWLSGTGREIT